jgi:hypothetical protein
MNHHLLIDPREHLGLLLLAFSEFAGTTASATLAMRPILS